MPSQKSRKKKEQKLQKGSTKVNFMKIFVQDEQKYKNPTNTLNHNTTQKRITDFDKILNSEIIDIEQLQKLSWNGIPQGKFQIIPVHRSKAWKLLLKYTSTNKNNHDQLLDSKRKDYFHLVDSYIDNPDIEHDQQEKKVIKLIHDDVIRTIPASPLFREPIVQQMLQRILYVWYIRHPSSGYVQGLNDIVTPFLIVFLSEYIEIDMKNVEATSDLKQIKMQDLKNVEADCYWCFTKMLNGVLHNYTNGWPGIKQSFDHIKLIIQRVDPAFLAYFQAKDINFYHIYFKWVACLLLRQFSIETGLRLFDTFISLESTQGQSFTFVQYIFVAIFLKYSKQLKNLNFQELMTFENKMPTKNWNQDDIGTIIAEAFVYQSYFNPK